MVGRAIPWGRPGRSVRSLIPGSRRSCGNTRGRWLRPLNVAARLSARLDRGGRPPGCDGSLPMRTTLLAGALLMFACRSRDPAAAAVPTEAVVRSADGVEIAYTARGEGDVALVFIHGGFADRSFWSRQLEVFAGRYRTVALDLAGHGASGKDRTEWTLGAFGEDVLAVMDALRLRRTVLIGNSLGGPVALEAARRAPERVLGVIAVDTLQDASRVIDPGSWKAYVESLKHDFEGTVRGLVKRNLFHPHAGRDRAPDPRGLRRLRHGGRPEGGPRPGPVDQRRPHADGRGGEPPHRARLRGGRHGPHGSLPHARTAGGVRAHPQRNARSPDRRRRFHRGPGSVRAVRRPRPGSCRFRGRDGSDWRLGLTEACRIHSLAGGPEFRHAPGSGGDGPRLTRTTTIGPPRLGRASSGRPGSRSRRWIERTAN